MTDLEELIFDFLNETQFLSSWWKICIQPSAQELLHDHVGDDEAIELLLRALQRNEGGLALISMISYLSGAHPYSEAIVIGKGWERCSESSARNDWLDWGRYNRYLD